MVLVNKRYDHWWVDRGRFRVVSQALVAVVVAAKGGDAGAGLTKSWALVTVVGAAEVRGAVAAGAASSG